MKQYIVNERIRSKEVRLIDENKVQVGVIEKDEAMKIAEEKGLDLLLVSNASDPPVCRLVDIGQYKYEQKKKDKESRKGAKAQVIKELKMSPKISGNDYGVRLKSCQKFLGKGYKVKLSIIFKGRENAHPELGQRLVDKFILDVDGHGEPESDVFKANRSLVVIFGPKTKSKPKIVQEEPSSEKG